MTELILKDVQIRYERHVAVCAAEARFRSGEFIALAGPNGAGKSSLLRACAGLVRPQSGQARLDQAEISGMAPRERARRIAYLPAESRAAWPMPARRIAALGRAPYLKPLRRLSDADEAAIDGALERAGASHLAERPFDLLSSGEKARVLIARALAAEAEILLLDEPAAALDPRHQLVVMELLKAEAERGALVIMAAHGLDLIAAYASRVLVLDGGRIAADGPPLEVLDEAILEQVFGVRAEGGLQPAGLRPV